jgi:hypothetical protein
MFQSLSVRLVVLFVALCVYAIIPTEAARADAETSLTPTEARRGIPIVFGGGEDISFVRDLPAAGKKYAAKKYPKGIKVGMKYSVFHIFFVNIWTWNGKYVLFDDNGYAEPNAKEWDKLLGKGGEKKLKKPFWYKFPPGAVIIAVLLALVAAAAVMMRNNPGEAGPDDQSAGGGDTQGDDDQNPQQFAA